MPAELSTRPDGTRIIGVVDASKATAAGGAVAPAIQVVLQWTEELKQRVPTR